MERFFRIIENFLFDFVLLTKFNLKYTEYRLKLIENQTNKTRRFGTFLKKIETKICID